MNKLALLGKNISQSNSPKVYKELLGDNVSYELWDCESPPSFEDIKLKLNSVDGLSVTAPYKRVLENFDIKYQNSFEKEFKIVNTLKLVDEVIHATNTDLLACDELIKKYNISSYDTCVLLGSGAMAKMLSFLLKKENISFVNFSRSQNRDLNKVDYSSIKNSIFINCCSKDFVFLQNVDNSNAFWDLNYNFEAHQNKFKSYIDGQELLKLQAMYALSFWGISY